jgi:hypothetical protein
MKPIEALQQKVDEAMESVQAIQGEQFRDLLGYVMANTQLMRMMSMAAQKYEDDELLQVLAKQMAHVLAKSSAMLADAWGIEDDKVTELMKWVETMDGHIVSAMKEASRE